MAIACVETKLVLDGATGKEHCRVVHPALPECNHHTLMGMRRSQARMRELEAKLRKGMTDNGVLADAQEQIIQSIQSFALYEFPESHAASFALIAYASAYLKCHYLAAFTAAILNNQPMGFYSPSTLVKDAQLHGLRVKPIDVLRSDWFCTLEREVHPEASNNKDVNPFAMRLGLLYARGLRQEAADALVNAHKSESVTVIRSKERAVSGLRRCDYLLACGPSMAWVMV